MVTSSYDTLTIADPATSWQDPFYESRRANMTKAELAAIDAVEAYAIRHGKADTNLNTLHTSLWMHWKYSTGTVKANRHELDLLAEFVKWLNLEP